VSRLQIKINKILKDGRFVFTPLRPFLESAQKLSCAIYTAYIYTVYISYYTVSLLLCKCYARHSLLQYRAPQDKGLENETRSC